MHKIMLGLAFLGAVTVGSSAYAEIQSGDQGTVQPIYWNGDYCGPRCQEHQWRLHERREAFRQERRHRHWEERHSGYYGYPRY
jgi:hypothetical protein